MDIYKYLEVITNVAVILGVFIVFIELRHYHQSKNRESITLLINSFQSKEFSQGVSMIIEMPDNLSADGVKKYFGKENYVLHMVLQTLDKIGVLVSEGEMPIELVDKVYGNVITLTSKKLNLFIHDFRSETQQESIYQWFDWLYNKITT